MCSENKNADQLCSNCTADLCLCLCLGLLLVFVRSGSYLGKMIQRGDVVCSRMAVDAQK